MNTLHALIERNPDTCYTQINQDTIVILNPADENFYHLNESAIDLWLLLDKPKTVLELTTMLAEKYSGNPEEYQQDVIAWVDDTNQKGLLTFIDKLDI